MKGPVYNHFDKILSDYDFYDDYKQGCISQKDFIKKLEKHREEFKDRGINEWIFSHFKRLPASDETATRKAIEVLYENNIISSKKYNQKKYKEFKNKMESKFQHNGFSTYIFPEEARLAYAISDIIKPETVFVAGSYYGYWASWTFPGVKETNGKVLLSDIDSEVTKQANTNIKNLGFEKTARAISRDAEKILKSLNLEIDLFLLDAYGDINDPRPQYRGKAIYEPLFKAALPRLQSESIILVHNVVEHNSKSLKKFFQLVDKHCSVQLEINTTSGVGIYVKD